MAVMGKQSGKRGPDPGQGPRLGKGELPPGQWQKDDGCPKLTIRLKPPVHDWTKEQGGAKFVRGLVEAKYQEAHGASELIHEAGDPQAESGDQE